ncbi:MAG TPA: ABC transporter ATP-binding protein [Parachlamydiaceae bacterium]|nr:ABC transporter ATP-binding protein [Parachlamydiaceae bacterium]
MDSQLAVEAKNVSKSFVTGQTIVKALQHVNFNARFGELLMIVGPSGCGKTTLLSIIAGTLRASSGEVQVTGKTLNTMSDNEVTAFRRVNVGFIFQQYHLIKTLNCLENVSIPMILNGYSKEESENAAVTILNELGLKGRELEFPKNMSGGQQQRVAIARALVHEPKLVICDEPTAALDAATGEKILALLVKAAKNPDRSVLLVTHDPRIFKYADRIAKMDDGKMVSIEENHIQGVV